MTTKYEQGRAAEYTVQRELEAEGYTTLRAAGSKGKTDVLAWNDVHYRHIQVKTFKDRVGNYAEDIEALTTIRTPPNATKELWIKQRGKRGWFKQIVLQETTPIP